MVLTVTSLGIPLKASADVSPGEGAMSDVSTNITLSESLETHSTHPTNDSPDAASLQSRNQYRSDRFGFRFTYPTGYEIAVGHPDDAAVEEYIIFLRQDDIDDPEPPFVSVQVYANPRQLSLEDFRAELGYFVIQEFEPTTVAGQDAIDFESAGLYIDRHYLFKTPDGAHIVSLYASSDVEPLWTMAEGIRHSFQW